MFERNSTSEKYIQESIELKLENSNLKEYCDNQSTIHKSTLDLLNSNNSRIELAMKAANMAWWEMDFATGKVTFDKRKTEMLGYSSEKFKHYTDFVDLVHPEDREGAMNAMRGYINGSFDKYEIEYRILTKSGEYKWFYDIGSIVKRDSTGLPLSIAGLVIDISSRKQSEQSLKDSETRYRRLFESAKDGILILDADTGMIVEVNPFLIELLSFSADQFSEKAIWEIGFFKDIVANHEKFIELRQNKYIRYDDLPLETADGRKIHVEFVSNVYLVDNKEVIQCNIRDITERKKAETDLKKLQTAIEYSEVSILITNNKGDIEYANPFFSILTGYTQTEYTGRNPRLLKSGYHSREFYKELWDTINSGKTWQGELHNCKKNGQLFWENAIISPIQNSKGEITHFVAIKTDITDAKKNIEELIAAKEHAEESDRLKSAFLNNMSHEIRTPMNGILGFAGLLKLPSLTIEKQKEYIKLIEKSSLRMLNIITEIIDISKIESGEMKVHYNETNINQQLKFVYDLFRPEMDCNCIDFSFSKNLSEKDAFIRTDKEKLYTVMTNLVKNAIKYTDKGSIEFGYKEKGNYLEFFVKDTGIGIPANRHKAVFERFIQADISDVQARQGAGLGLSIAKAFVEMLGGTIWVESEPGKGSTFYFTLPAKS